MPLSPHKPWVGLHGIWDDGADTVIKLLDYMGVPYYLPEYHVNPFTARRKDIMPFLPHEALNALRPNLVCHSAGCLMAHRLMQRGHKFGTIFYFSSAMDRNVLFKPDSYEKIYNIYCPNDLALLCGSFMFLHPFGAMGRKGYNGKSPNVVNVEASFKATERFNHSNYFLDENINEWANFCLERS